MPCACRLVWQPACRWSKRDVANETYKQTCSILLPSSLACKYDLEVCPLGSFRHHSAPPSQQRTATFWQADGLDSWTLFGQNWSSAMPLPGKFHRQRHRPISHSKALSISQRRGHGGHGGSQIATVVSDTPSRSETTCTRTLDMHTLLLKFLCNPRRHQPPTRSQ